MKIISLGWGIQSFTLLAMSALGQIERADYAIHADTTHERSGTYAFAKKMKWFLQMYDFNVVTVKNDTGLINKYGGVMIPAYIENGGMIGRQCTDDWKRKPIKQWIQKHRNKGPVEQWIGISLDEATRMKPSDVKYITNRWPLIEMRMTRLDCVNWLNKHGLPVPPKSACVFCPFQHTDEWRCVMDNEVDRRLAIDADNSIREARMPGRLFIHPARKPISEVDLRTEQEKGQYSLWDEECWGICGV